MQQGNDKFATTRFMQCRLNHTVVQNQHLKGHSGRSCLKNFTVKP